MSDAGIFCLRGVLVGTVAFQTYAGYCGARLPGAPIQTAGADVAQHYSVSSSVEGSLPPVLETFSEALKGAASEARSLQVP
ncbi:GSU2403 family nucleotidyltransferase fold protein [Chelativorans alearense]|uniref:GSU2403 family nucleotidyltransferase fold protein n=1 Tax=Chelativorans alearense TaxID=2681495 RepID=UPI0013D0445E|nr:GSU2403 family nucleotidyltransferase fold protein [Chelativorans alearense]